MHGTCGTFLRVHHNHGVLLVTDLFYKTLVNAAKFSTSEFESVLRRFNIGEWQSCHDEHGICAVRVFGFRTLPFRVRTLPFRVRAVPFRVRTLPFRVRAVPFRAAGTRANPVGTVPLRGRGKSLCIHHGFVHRGCFRLARHARLCVTRGHGGPHNMGTVKRGDRIGGSFVRVHHDHGVLLGASRLDKAMCHCAVFSTG